MKAPRDGQSVISLAPLAGRGSGEGLFFEFGQERLENPVQILNDIVVPDADHPITEGTQPAVAPLVFAAFRVLTAVEFDNQTPLAANEVDVISIDGLLADEFEAAKLPVAEASPQREFCRRECAPLRWARSVRCSSLARNAPRLPL